MQTPLFSALIAVAAVAITSCGGGSGGGGSGGGSGSAVPPANPAPVASFTANPSSGSAPLTVQLDASASTDTGGSIASYAWNFGDNSAAGSGAATSHVFQTTGTHTVTLTVTDNGGATGSTTRQVSIGQVPTVSKIAAIDTGDMTVCVRVALPAVSPTAGDRVKRVALGTAGV